MTAKRLWTWIFIAVGVLLLFAFATGLIHAQTALGPSTIPQLNSVYYIGNQTGAKPFYPTLQSGVTGACTSAGATVIIPAGSPADGNSGYTISAVTGGCVKAAIVDYRVVPAVSYLWNGSAYLAQGTGGGATFPASGIPFATSTLTSRNATAADVIGLWTGTCTGTNVLQANGVCGSGGGGGVNLIIPGTNVTCTPFVSGTCVGNVTINSSGGSSPPSPAFSVPFTNSGVTAFQSDTPFFYAPSVSLLETKNQDISGSLVHFVVNPIQPAFPGSNGTSFLDFGTFNDDTIFAQGMMQHSSTYAGHGYNYGNGPNVTNGWTTSIDTIQFDTWHRSGIHIGHTVNQVSRSDGDFINTEINQFATCCAGTGASDEGEEVLHLANWGELPFIYFGTVGPATPTTGTKSLPINAAGNECAGGCLMMDTTQGIGGYYFTGPFAGAGDYFVAPTGGTALTPSTAYGYLSCPGGLPQVPVVTTPVSITCNVENMLGSSGTGFTTGIATKSGNYPEQVAITAVGTKSGSTQSVTFTYTRPELSLWFASSNYVVTTINGQNAGSTTTIIDTNGHNRTSTVPCVSGSTQPTWTNGVTPTDGTCHWIDEGFFGIGSMLWQGGPQGNAICQNYFQTFNPNQAWPVCYIALGAVDSTHIASEIRKNGQGQLPNNFYVALTLGSLSKTGTTVTALSGTGAAAYTFNGMAAAQITGCSDNNLNTPPGGGGSAATNFIFSGSASGGQYTWTQAGGGVSCASAVLTYDAVSGTSPIAFNLYPYAEQLAIDESEVVAFLETNGVAWHLNDSLVQPHPVTWGTTLISGQYEDFHPGVNEGALFEHSCNGAGCSGQWKWINFINNEPVTNYIGAGGILTAPILMNITGPNSGILSGGGVQMPMNDRPAFDFDCPAEGCQNGQTETLFIINHNQNNGQTGNYDAQIQFVNGVSGSGFWNFDRGITTSGGLGLAGTTSAFFLNGNQGTSGLCVISGGPGATPTWGSCGGGGSFTALTGDATSTSTGGATEVVGLLNHVLPSLATGFLNWTGSAWALSAGGTGTVTSVGLTVPSWLTVMGSPVTGAGTLAVTGTSESANLFLASPNGSSGPVTPRAIVAGDVPTLNQSTTGNAATATALAATPTLCSTGNAPTGILANGNATGCASIGGSGTVTHTTGALTALQLVIGNGSADVKVDPNASTDGAGNMSATSYTASGPGPGYQSLVANSGSLPALVASSAGWVGPVSGGTAWLGKLPATITAGLLHFAAPATGDGVNESVVTSSAVNLAADVAGVLPAANGGFPVGTTATATPGTGITSVTCATATCTNLRGTYTVVGGTATTGTIFSLAWTATPTAYVCTATMNGGVGFLGIGNSVATTTGMNVTAGVTVLGVTFSVNYSCEP
jgi:hypothetical protein